MDLNISNLEQATKTLKWTYLINNPGTYKLSDKSLYFFDTRAEEYQKLPFNFNDIAVIGKVIESEDEKSKDLDGEKPKDAKVKIVAADYFLYLNPKGSLFKVSNMAILIILFLMGFSCRGIIMQYLAWRDTDFSYRYFRVIKKKRVELY